MLTLWYAHTHAAAHFYVTPRLILDSAEPGSGKTRVLEVAQFLVAAPEMTISATPAALFRMVSEGPITILFDEVDAIFNAKTGGNNEDLRALLNAGYKRTATIARCVGDAKARARPEVGEEWTDTGKSNEERALKHREDGTPRTVPCPPALTEMLHHHVATFGTAADGRLFRGARNGGRIGSTVYGRAWAAARQAVFTAEVAAGPLAKRPYDLRAGSSGPGRTDTEGRVSFGAYSGRTAAYGHLRPHTAALTKNAPLACCRRSAGHFLWCGE
jgi:hypothetical protein